MTDQETALRKMLAKSTDARVLREMIGFAAERLMELEVGGMTGAARGERNADRLPSERWQVDASVRAIVIGQSHKTSP